MAQVGVMHPLRYCSKALDRGFLIMPGLPKIVVVLGAKPDPRGANVSQF